MSQDITFIEAKKIKSAKSGKKGLANAVLDQLYDSVSKEGLLNPISVRPDASNPGCYKIVAGEHRFYVVSKMCKDEVIACRVFADMSDEEAELAGLSENACRTNAKPTDRLLLLRKWQDVYQKHFPLLQGKKASGNSRWANSTKAAAKQAAVDAEKAKDAADAASENFSNDHNGHYTNGEQASDSVSAEVEAASEEPAEPTAKPVESQTLRDRIKSITGISNTTMTRDMKINNNLSEEQVYFLDKVQCTRNQMIQIIDSTGDEAKRNEIVNLVVSGMEVDRAIAEVVTEGTVPEVKVEEKKEEPESEEAWFLRSCGEFAGCLGDPDQYKSDAILYRRISDARNKFRKSIKKIVADYRVERKGKKVGWFFLQLHKILNISYPSDWKLCGTCTGSGLVDPGIECPSCHGACYQTASEKYT